MGDQEALQRAIDLRLGRCDVPEMTLRDYLAGQAINGLLLCSTKQTYMNVPMAAYDLADAMLEARKSTKDETND